MNDYTYEIEIIQDKKQSYSKGFLILHWVGLDNDLNIPKPYNKVLKFNFLTILGDLRNQKEPYQYPYGRLQNNHASNISSTNYEYEYGFGEPLYVGNDETYLKFINEINNILIHYRNRKIKSLNIVEELEKRYKLNLNCTIQIQTPNPLSQMSNNRAKKFPQYTYKELHYEYGKKNTILTKNKYLEEEHKFIYKCFSLKEVLLSILHYLVIHSYTFKRCSLCQKDYAKGKGHGRFSGCDRISEYNIESYLSGKQKSDYLKSNKTCRDTLKFFKRQNSYDEKNITHYYDSTRKNVTEYRKIYDKLLEKHKDRLDEKHCYNNLEKIHFIVCPKAKNEIWRQKDKVTFYKELKKLNNILSNKLFLKRK